MHVRYRDHVISTWFVEVIVSFVLARKKTGNLHTPVFYIYVSFCLMLSIVKAERVVSQRVVRLSRLEWRCIDVVQCVIVQASHYIKRTESFGRYDNVGYLYYWYYCSTCQWCVQKCLKRIDFLIKASVMIHKK